MTNSLSFYENERDGPELHPVRTCETRLAHLNDENAMTYLIPTVNSNGNFKGDLTPLGVTIDAAGGWWDAGDYLKFTETISYVVGMMETDVRDFPTQLGSGSATAELQRRGGVRAQLARADVERQHENAVSAGRHRRGQHQDHGRPRHLAAAAGGRHVRRHESRGSLHPEPAGLPRGSARVRSSAPTSPAVSRRTSRSATSSTGSTEPSQAATCLKDAEDVFALANTHPGRLQTAIPFDFYPEKEWRDDLEWGATEIYDALVSGLRHPRASRTRTPPHYLKAAAHWARAYINGPQ